MLTLLFLVLLSVPAVASHFKGGQVTYKYLGNGQYEMTTKGYWDKDAVGSVVLSYEGSPTINTGTTTVSKTLLPDGMTVEHIQRQRITWSKPGLYQISWKSCCRANGSNFGAEESGLFAAVNYNPDAVSSSPQFYDLPIFNYNVESAISFNMNMEDAEGHGQEYSLEIPYGLTGDPYKLMKETGFSISNDGIISWEKPLKGLWLVNVKLREKINGEFTGAFVLRDFILNITSSDNTPPVFTSVEEQYVTQGQTISFEVSAQDAQQQNIALNANSSLLEKGATFAQSVFGNAAKGTFTWATKAEDLGRYAVQFVATDSDIVPLSAQMTVYINVVEKKEEVCATSVTYTINSAPCAGGSNGKVTLTGTNGTAPYTYSLDGGTSFRASATFDKLAAGTYSAVVKDAKGCTSAPVQVKLTTQASSNVIFALPTSSICASASPLALSGGSPAGGNYTGTGVTNGSFHPAVAGVGTHTITYTYTNESGCSSTASQRITVVAPTAVNAGPDQTVTVGYNSAAACATLTASAEGTSYTYRWSNGATTQTIKVCPTTTTTYTVTLTDAFGCTSSDEVTVFVKDVRCGNKKEKVVVCHKGKPICIAPQAVQAHLDHGCVVGDCSDSPTTDAKEESTEGAIVSVFPNPMSSQSQLHVITKEKGNITIDILDMNGKVVLKLHKGEVQAGQELNYELKRSIGPNNIYIGRIITEKGVQTFKLMIAE